jgi:hypothetical protein
MKYILDFSALSLSKPLNCLTSETPKTPDPIAFGPLSPLFQVLIFINLLHTNRLNRPYFKPLRLSFTGKLKQLILSLVRS